MLCFSISEQEVEDALSNTRTTFCNSTAVGDKPADLEQCINALKVAVDTLAKMKKDGKRALKKAHNLRLKSQIESAYKELRQLQDDSGPEKAQKCFELAVKWRNSVNALDPIQPQPPVHGSGRSVYSASISSGGSHIIPDQFYQTDMASKSGGNDSYDEENSIGSTPGSSEVALNESRIEEPNDSSSDGHPSHPAKPRVHYQKHTGCYVDAAPRVALFDIGQEFVGPTQLQTVLDVDGQPAKTQISLQLTIARYERPDASVAVPSAPVGTVLFNKLKVIAPGEVDIGGIVYTHAEVPNARRTIKWMNNEDHWRREAGILLHLKNGQYIAELFPLFGDQCMLLLPASAKYRYVLILDPFSRTLDSDMNTESLTSTQIRQLTASLSDALRWCHDKHTVHLNIRPTSFFIGGVPGQNATDNGKLVWKLWNFGQARFVGEPIDTAITTATYAAPEVLNGRRNGTKVLAATSMDLWSLGLILYKLHTGGPYFPSDAFAESLLTLEGDANFEPNLEAVKDQDARQAIRGLLEVDPTKRYTLDTLRDVYYGKV